MDVRIGEMYIGAAPGDAALPAPRGLMAQARSTGAGGGRAEVRLRWAPDPAAAHHDVYADDGQGRWVWQGRVTGTAYHAVAVPVGGDSKVRLRLVASPPGLSTRPGMPADIVVAVG